MNRSLLASCLDGDDYVQHLINVSFSGESANISFNQDGDMLGVYRCEILCAAERRSQWVEM